MQEHKSYRKKSKLGYGERHHNGKLVRRPVGGRRDNRAVAVRVTTDRQSKHLLEGRLDGRSAVGKQVAVTLAELREHLGSDISIPQDKLCQQAARLDLLTSLCWGELMKAKGLVVGDSLHPAFDRFLKSARQYTQVLSLLGLQRRTRDISLEDVLQGRVEHGTS